jgi:hypothetical protein
MVKLSYYYKDFKKTSWLLLLLLGFWQPATFPKGSGFRKAVILFQTTFFYSIFPLDLNTSIKINKKQKKEKGKHPSLKILDYWSVFLSYSLNVVDSLYLTQHESFIVLLYSVFQASLFLPWTKNCQNTIITNRAEETSKPCARQYVHSWGSPISWQFMLMAGTVRDCRFCFEFNPLLLLPIKPSGSNQTNKKKKSPFYRTQRERERGGENRWKPERYRVEEGKQQHWIETGCPFGQSEALAPAQLLLV